jgi:hypothetical protein
LPFNVPQFPLRCAIFDGNGIVDARLTDVPCNLAWGRRVGMPSIQTDVVGPDSGFEGTMTILFPKDTDVRDAYATTGFDAIECPQDSGRFYSVMYADDIGKGFPNEHRAAQVKKRVGADGFWPTPMP